MSADEKDQSTEEKDQSSDDGNFELSDDGKEKVKQMRATYDDDRPTAVLPGTDNTITGVAVNEWIDDDGNPKFGQDEDHENKDKEHEDADKQTEDAG